MLTKISPKFILFDVVFAQVASAFAAIAAVLASAMVFVGRGLCWPLVYLIVCGSVSVLLFVVARRLQAKVIGLFSTKGKGA